MNIFVFLQTKLTLTNQKL